MKLDIYKGKSFISINRKDSFFFHKKEFVTRDTNNDGELWQFVITIDNMPVGDIWFTINEQCATSLNRSPFGCFNIDHLTESEMSNVTNQIVSCLQEETSAIKIVNHPSFYNKELSRVVDHTLTQIGFEKQIEQAQYLPVKEEFKRMVSPSEKRYLNAASDFTFQELSIEVLEEAYDLFVESRENKGYPVTMSLEQLNSTFHQFPSNYRLFGLYDHHTLIAASVCIVINSSILYDFYHGDRLTYRKKSPVVPLLGNIYDLASKEGFEYLDLGVSTDRGAINEGLYSFKKNLGAISSDKVSYLFSLS